MPAFKELLHGKVYDSGVYSNGGLIVARPLVLLKQFLCGSFGGLYSEGGPGIYCTLICLGLAVFALYQKKSNRAGFLVSLVILVLLMILVDSKLMFQGFIIDLTILHNLSQLIIFIKSK